MSFNNKSNNSHNTYSSFSSYSRRKLRPMSEINVTPMVDIMLVLLIVFMVSAPLLTTGVPINLPKATASALSEAKEPLTVSINKDGDVFLQNSKVNPNELVEKLLLLSNNNKQIKVYIRADSEIFYGKVMKVMAKLNLAGFSKVALITKSME